MTTLIDTAQGVAGTGGGDIVQGQKFEYGLGGPQDFNLAVVNNLISGQATGTTVLVTVRGPRGGKTVYTVPYGQLLNVSVRGYLVTIATLPVSPNADVRVVISEEYQYFVVQTVAATILGQPNVNIAQVSGATPNLAKESGGNLASAAGSVATSAGTVAVISGTPMGIVSVQDPPQGTSGGGKKYVPTHDVGA